MTVSCPQIPLYFGERERGELAIKLDVEWMLVGSTGSKTSNQTKSGHKEHPRMGTRRVKKTLWVGGGVRLSPDPKLVLGMCERRGNFPSSSGFASSKRGR